MQRLNQEGHRPHNVIDQSKSSHARKLRISGFIPRCLNPRLVSFLSEIAVIFEWYKNTKFGSLVPEIAYWARFMCAVLDALATYLATSGGQRIFFRMRMRDDRSPPPKFRGREPCEDQILMSFRYHGILDSAANVARRRPFVVDGDLSTQFNERFTGMIARRSRFLDATEPIMREQEQQTQSAG